MTSKVQTTQPSLDDEKISEREEILFGIYDVVSGNVVHAFEEYGGKVGPQVVMMTALAVHNYLLGKYEIHKMHLNDTLDMTAVSIAAHLSGVKGYASISDYVDIEDFSHDKAFDVLWKAIEERQRVLHAQMNEEVVFPREGVELNVSDNKDGACCMSHLCDSRHSIITTTFKIDPTKTRNVSINVNID